MTKRIFFRCFFVSLLVALVVPFFAVDIHSSGGEATKIPLPEDVEETNDTAGRQSVFVEPRQVAGIERVTQHFMDVTSFIIYLSMVIPFFVPLFVATLVVSILQESHAKAT